MMGELMNEPAGAPLGAVACTRCRKVVDLSKPLQREGWQVVHICQGQVIEALVAAPGALPWAWRSSSSVGKLRQEDSAASPD